jgi:membrane-bound lytic murein transglycosylase F
MPATAESLGFEDTGDPETGIHAGIKYLDHLRDRFDTHIPMNERTWLALAAYNIGYGRVSRARVLASELGLNPDKWFDNVEIAMRQMTRSSTASVAGCRCGQAIIYVRAIRSLYYAYRNLVLAVKTPQQTLGPQPTRNRQLPVRKTRTG